MLLSTMLTVTNFALLAFLLQLSDSARILGVIRTPSYSHQVVFQPLWKELSLRGHQVTVLTTNPVKDPTLTNLTEIDLSSSHKLKSQNILTASNLSTFEFMNLWIESYINITNHQLEHPQVKKLIADPDEHFDLVITEFINIVPFYFSRRFSCPFIGVLSVDPNNYLYQRIGNPTHTILYPDILSNIYSNPNIVQRIFLAFRDVLFLFYTVKIQAVEQKLVLKHFNDTTPIEDVTRNASMLFVNSNPIFDYVRPLVPSVIRIGGSTERIPVKPLQKELKVLLDEAHEGFIYFSLGSNFKSTDIPERTINVIIETFRELPYKVLWKYELGNLPNKPTNVILSKWVSQYDILAHPNIKLFITQGGSQSIDEAIFARTPIVGIPVWLDQPYNIQKMVAKGCGLAVDYYKLTKKVFLSAILEVIQNPKYQARITELADLSIDEPMTGLERAVWWTEYVIRHNGAAHLRSPLLDIPWYQFYFVDVIAVILVCFLVVFIVIVVSIKSLGKLLTLMLSIKVKTKTE